MSITQDGRVGELITPLGKDVLVLQRFDGFEGLGELFEFHVDALSEQEDIDFDKAIGQSCTIKLKTYQGKTRIIDGILTEAQSIEKAQDYYRYLLVLRPWFALLGYKADCRTFLDKNVKDIIKDVFTRAGFSDYEFKTTADYDTIHYCVQYRETDLAFCSRLMEQYGIYYFFKHAEGKHTMVLADSRASHETNPDVPKLPYLPLGTRALDMQQRLGAWTSHRRFRTGKVHLDDYDYVKPPKNLKANKEAAEKYAHSKLEVYDFRGKHTEKDKGEQFAKFKLEAEQSLDHRRRAEGDCPSAFAGSLVTVEQHPTAAENKEYLIVRATHRFGTQEYRAGAGGGSGSYTGNSGGGGETYSGNYEFQPSDQPFRNQERTGKPRIYGICSGLVVANTGEDGEEISTEQFGRIRVQYPWDSAQQSYWARVAQVWAGNHWGGQFIPRVGMEVVVEFEQGDPDYPLVVGCVYNGNNPYPYDLPANKTQSGLKSDSSKGHGGYNELMFEDKKGSEKVRFHAQKDLESVIENNESRQVGNNQTLTVGNNRSVTVTTNDSLTVDMNRSVTISANDSLTVSANRTVTADVMITLICGASSIVMTPGSIIINSPSIMLVGPTVMSGPGTIGGAPII